MCNLSQGYTAVIRPIFNFNLENEPNDNFYKPKEKKKLIENLEPAARSKSVVYVQEEKCSFVTIFKFVFLYFTTSITMCDITVNIVKLKFLSTKTQVVEIIELIVIFVFIIISNNKSIDVTF